MMEQDIAAALAGVEDAGERLYVRVFHVGADVEDVSWPRKKWRRMIEQQREPWRALAATLRAEVLAEAIAEAERVRAGPRTPGSSHDVWAAGVSAVLTSSSAIWLVVRPGGSRIAVASASLIGRALSGKSGTTMSGRGRIKVGQMTLSIGGKEVLRSSPADLETAWEGEAAKVWPIGNLGEVDADTERALTLHRPWGEAIIHGPKRLENRPNPPPRDLVGKRIVIHAGLTWDKGGAPACLALWARERPESFRGFGEHFYQPAGAFLGTARIVGSVGDMGRRALHTEETARLVRVAAEAVQEDRASWWSGPWALVLDEIRALEEPVPSAPGVFHRGYWRLGVEDRRALAAANWRG